MSPQPTPPDGAPASAPGPEVLADAVATAVRAVPGVADLHPGTFGEVATYLPGRRVAGVRLRADGSAEVHLVVTARAPLLETADLVRAAVSTFVPGPVDVAVQDVVDPAATTATGGDSTGTGGASTAPPS